MNRIAGFITRLACIAALLATASCVQEVQKDSVRISDTAIVLQDGELSYQFDVVSNTAWTLTCLDADGNNADWFSVTPSSGNGTTKVTLNIIKENHDLSNRSGKIIVSSGDAISEATVTQRGLSKVISFIDPRVVAISSASATSGRFTLVLSNGGAAVTAKLPSDAAWLSNLQLIEDVDTGYSVRKTWSFDVAANNMSDMRSATVDVAVSAKGRTDRYSVRIEQSGQGAPAIKTPDVVYMGSNQSTQTQPFWVEGSKDNLTYKISCASASMDTGEPWITDARVEGENLVITATPNTYSESREGSVYIVGTRSSAAGSGASTALSVKVYQAGHSSAGIQMGASEVSVGYVAASHFVSFVLLNGSKISGKPEANVSWISDIKASDEGRLTYSVSEYNAASDEADYREGIISFKVENGSSNAALASLKVRQYSSQFSDITLPVELSLQAKSGAETIPFDADGGKLEVVDNGTDWLTALCVESGGLSVIKVSATDWAAGDAGSALRSGLVTLKYTKNGRTAYHYVNVYQYAPAVRDISVPAAFNLDSDDETLVFNLGLRGGRIGDIVCTSPGGWLKSASVKESGDIAEVTVKVDKWSAATDGASSRNGMLCIPYTYDGLTMYHYVQINQKSQAFKDIVLPDEVSLPAKWAYEIVPYDLAGGTLEVLKSEVAGDWLSAGNFDFDGDSFLMVAADDWTVSDADSDFRSALVVLKYSKNGMSAYHYMTVRQYAPKVRDTSMPSALSLNYDETSTSFMVALNGGGIGTIQCSSQDGWIKNARANVNGGNAEIVIEAEKWNGSMSASSDRTGIICIPYVYDGFTMYHYVQVSQKPEPFADIRVPVAITLHSSAVSSEFYLDASRGDVSGITSSADWLDVRSVNQNGVCSVTIRPDAYSGDALSRSCLLSIPYRIGTTSVTYYVTVTQFNANMSVLDVSSVITLSHSQTSAESEMALTVATVNVSAVGAPVWTSEGGWLTDVAKSSGSSVSSLKLTLTASKWEDAPSTSIFRQGDIVIPFTREGKTVFYHALAYQYSKDVVGIDIPSELRIKAAEVEKTIPVNGAKSGTLTAEYDHSAVSWITSVTASPSSIVVKTLPGFLTTVGEHSRSAVVTFTYTINGIRTVYNMTVTQELVSEPEIYLDGIRVFRHFNWSDPEESERNKVKYTSFAWLDPDSKEVTAEGVAIGIATSYGFKEANQKVNCSNPDLFGDIEMTECTLESGYYYNFKLTFKNPDFSQWNGTDNVTLTFNVGEGKTMEYPLELDVYNHKPDRVEGLGDCVPDVSGKDESQFTSKTFSLDNLATPESERYSKFEIQGVFADKECSTPLSPTQINSVGTASDGRNYSIKMSYDKSHTHEAGYFKGMLSTESGKSEIVSIPYRLYPVVSQKSSMPALNKVAFAIDEFVNVSEYWDFQQVMISPDDPNNGKVSVAMQGNYIVFGWEEDMTSRYVLAKLLFTFKKNSFGDDGRISQKEMTIRLDYQNAPELLNGVFSVSADKKVRFTRSNLAYVHNSGGLVFRDSQIFPPIGNAKGNADPRSTVLNDDKDLFYWSTIGNKYGLIYKNISPFDRTTSGFSDWGSYFSGKNYRTMTADEWEYLYKRGVRVTVDGDVKGHPAYIFTKVCNRPGVLLLPDEFVWNTLTMGPYISGSESSSNLTAAKFSALEEAGAVWLPIAGTMYYAPQFTDYMGAYWTSSERSTTMYHAYYISIYNRIEIAYFDKDRYCFSVRLVRDY